MGGEATHVAVSAVADRAITRVRAECMGGVFNDHAVAPIEAREVNRQSGLVHRHHRRNINGDQSEINIPCRGVDIDDCWLCSDIASAIRAGHERQRRRDHHVTGPKASRRRRAVKGRCTRRERNRVPRADVFRYGILEAIDRRALRQPVTAEDLPHGVEILLRNRLTAVGDHGTVARRSRISSTLRNQSLESDWYANPSGTNFTSVIDGGAVHSERVGRIT